MSLAGAYRLLLSSLSSVGLDPAAVCAEADVDPRALDADGAPLSLAEVTRVLAHAEARNGDPLLGLHMAERTPGRGVLAYLARAQRTVGEALAAFERFAGDTWGTGAGVRVERRGARAVLLFQVRDVLPRHAIEFLVARTAISLRRSRAAAREVWFRHAPGGPAAEYARVFGCPVRFARDEIGLVLDAADLTRTQRTANAEAATALATALARAPEPQWPSLTVRLGAAIEEALAGGIVPEREALARSLGMSGKTLARRLQDEQRRFRDVVDEVRRLRAQQLVEEGTVDLTEVAARVGFADLAAFGKAFRRWFGASPSAVRARRRRG